MTDVSDAEWLAELFSVEYCAECGGDAQHHTAVPFLGNPFARCNYPPDADGNYHPTIIAFRNAEYDITKRLDYLRGQIEAESISYGEIAELRGLAEHIDPADVVLRQWAGVPEHDDEPPLSESELRAMHGDR